jgi:hypothetical protein
MTVKSMGRRGDSSALSLIAFKHPATTEIYTRRLIRLELSDTTLGDRNLSCIDFRGTTFLNVDLQNTDLCGCDLRHVRFVNVNIRGANLQSASLSGSKMINTSGILPFSGFDVDSELGIHDGGHSYGISVIFDGLPMSISNALSLWKHFPQRALLSSNLHNLLAEAAVLAQTSINPVWRGASEAMLALERLSYKQCPRRVSRSSPSSLHP